MSRRSRSGRGPAVQQAHDAAVAELQARAARPLNEQWVGELLKQLLGAQRWVPREVPGVNGMHDLDLEFGDGSRIAVEVTRHIAGNRAAFYAELDKRTPMRAASLQRGWMVDIDVPEAEAADAKSIRPLFARLDAELEPLLARAEKCGMHEAFEFISPMPGGPSEHPIRAKLRSLRVRHARALDWQRAGYIHLHQAGAATTFGTDDIVDAAEHEIAPNLDKLRRAKANGAAEAHLFIWVPAGTALSDAAQAAVRRIWECDDPRPLNMRGLDSVWIAATGLPGNFRELHGYSWPICQFDGDGWQQWERRWHASSP